VKRHNETDELILCKRYHHDCAEGWSETDNQATSPFGYSPCPRMAFLTVWPHCTNDRWNKCQEAFPLENCIEDHRDALVLHGRRLSSRTWNPITCPWTKQLTWLRIIHSGGWCLRLSLRTPSGACQKWMNEMNPILGDEPLSLGTWARHMLYRRRTVAKIAGIARDNNCGKLGMWFILQMVMDCWKKSQINS